MGVLSVEDRVSILEKEMAELKGTLSKGSSDWVSKICGSFKDDSEFGEILRLGREIRKADKASEVVGRVS